MKTTLLIIISAFTFFSCNRKEDSDTNEKIVRQYFDCFNRHDWKSMAAMYSEDAEFKDPSLGPGIVRQSHEQIVKKYGELNQAFPDVKDKVIAIYPSGENHVFVEFLSTGTTPDSTRFELPVCTIFKIENGLITQDFTYFDNF